MMVLLLASLPTRGEQGALEKADTRNSSTNWRAYMFETLLVLGLFVSCRASASVLVLLAPAFVLCYSGA